MKRGKRLCCFIFTSFGKYLLNIFLFFIFWINLNNILCAFLKGITRLRIYLDSLKILAFSTPLFSHLNDLNQLLRKYSVHVVVIQELHNNESVDWQQYCIEFVFKLTLTKQIFNHLINTIFINRNAYVLSL